MDVTCVSKVITSIRAIAAQLNERGTAQFSVQNVIFFSYAM
jgi:hypothetical protein